MAKRPKNNSSIPSEDILLKRIARLEAENACLRETKPELHDTVSCLPFSFGNNIALFTALPDTRIISTNSAFVSLTGHTAGHEPPLSFRSCFIENDMLNAVPLHTHFEKALEENVANIINGSLQRKDGSSIPASVFFWPEISDKHKQPSITGIVINVGNSSDKSLAAIVTESEKKYQVLLEHSLMGVVILQDFRFVYVNETFAAISEYTVDELLSLTPEQIQDSIHKDDREMVWNRLQARFDGKPAPERYEFRIITKHGNVRWVELMVNVIEYNGKPALFETMTDATERKIAEQAVINSEKLLTQIIQGNSIASFVIDESHRVTHWNRACEAMTGISSEDVIGTNQQWRAFYPQSRPVLADMVLDHRGADEIDILYNRFAQKSPLIEDAYEAEDFFPNLGAQGKWLFFTAAPIVDASGKTIGAIETLQDISQRRFFEQTLNESRQLLHFAIEQMPTPVIIASVPGLEVTMMNTAATSVLGLADGLTEPLPIHHLSTLCSFADADGTPVTPEQFPLTRAITQGTVTRGIELQIIHPPGKTNSWISTNAAPLVNEHGAIVAGIMIFPDITERKRHEQALRESEERFRAIINSSNDGIVIINSHGEYIEANDAFQRLVGYSKAEIMHLSFHDITPDKWHEKEAVFLRQIAIEGHGSFDKEYRAKDGTIVPVVLNCWKIPGTDPQGGHFGGFVRDVSREQRTEIQLRQTQKMEAIGTLAAGIAHDFNNALTSILMNTELLISDVSQSDPTFLPLNDIHISGIRAKELVEQILTFSRQSSQERSPISLVPVIKESQKILRASIPSTIEIVQNIDTTVKSIYANPTQMHQVIINLMTNAAHAMRDTGGILTMSLRSRHVVNSESYEPEIPSGRYVELTVSDTGHGMDQIIIERIFEPFYTTKSPGEGTGMGLAVVHGIVTTLGGYITVDSSPNLGTSFHILMPEYDFAQDIETASLEHRLEGTERILFIDDEPAINKVARLTLERLGYSVTSYDSSMGALETFQLNPAAFDLIITDLTMPGMTGLELAASIKAIRPDIPIIVCSGYNEAFDDHDPSEFGIAATVKKPFSKVTLASAIRNTMNRRTNL